jgi:hypothetical protein
MNIHYPRVERRSQLSSYLLAAFAVFTALMFVLSLSRHAELHWSMPSVTMHTAQGENRDLPVPVPAPRPPTVTAGPAAEIAPLSAPHVIPAPAPSVP